MGELLSGNVGSRAFHNARLQKKLKKQAETLLPAVIAAYQRGKHDEARMLCRQILSAQPDHFDALQLLGVLEIDGPRLEEAAQFLQRAVKVQPSSAEAFANLGLASFKLGRFEEARKSLAVKPDDHPYVSRFVAK